MASPRGAHRRASVAALLLALSCCFCCRAGARADPSSSGEPKAVPAVIVFGDSTVDTGNNNGIGTILKSDFPPYGRDMAGGAKPTGRFCNGRLPPDFISEALGLPPLVPAYLDPAYGIQDFAQGVCFASAGTGLDNKTAGVLEELQRGRFHDPGAENGRDDDDEWQRTSAVALQLQVAPPGIEGARPEPDGWLMDATLRPVFKAVGAGGPYLESLNFAVSVLLKTWSISNLKTD